MWNSIIVPGLDFNDSPDMPALLKVLDRIREVKAVGDQHVCVCGEPMDDHESDHIPVSHYIHTLDLLEREAEALGYTPEREGERIWAITKAMCKGRP